MNVLEIVAGQVRATGTSLFAVTLTAIPVADTPVLLMLHWHGFRHRQPSGELPMAPVKKTPIPSSVVQLNERWLDIGTLDQAMLDAAWQFGAWQLDREERRGCNTIGATGREAMECRQAFGDDPRHPGTEHHIVAEAPDRLEMMALGAQKGYVRWQFRPVCGGVWKDAGLDDSLGEDGRRPLPCPVGIRALAGTRFSRTQYRLGRIDRIILP